MDYIEGFVAAVPTTNKGQYIEHARKAADLLKAHGAERVVECWGDNVPEGEITSFPKAVKCKDDETVVFSWIVWPSKKARDQGWETIMEKGLMNDGSNPMPFDGKRIIHGGFETIVDE